MYMPAQQERTIAARNAFLLVKSAAVPLLTGEARRRSAGRGSGSPEAAGVLLERTLLAIGGGGLELRAPFLEEKEEE